MRFMDIIEKYDPEYDTPRDGPRVTWAERILAREVLTITGRLQDLESESKRNVTLHAPISKVLDVVEAAREVVSYECAECALKEADECITCYVRPLVAALAELD